VELRHLKHFVTVAETGGISAAARKLGITQPALSRQIKALEDDLEVVLLDRNARSFSLTPAAESLLVDARKLLDFCDGMTARARSAASGLPLRIGYSPSLAGDFLPHAIECFSQLHPAVRVSLHDASSVEMQQSLLAGKLDLVVSVPCTATDAVHWTTLRKCGWQLVVSPRHALAARDSIQPGDLHGAKLLLYDRMQYPDYWQLVTLFFKEHGIQAKIAGELDGISSLAAAVEANLGCAIVAQSTRVTNEGSARLISIPLEPQPEAIVVAAGVPARGDPPDHVRAFISEMKLQVSR
jgi:LysR family transcriptional regulator, benzoate and cis,cis-muconate-responsive activator of ben and cat genes